MRHPRRTGCLVSLGLSAALAGCATSPPADAVSPIVSPVDAFAPPIRAIVVDAGHGGHDPGAMHHGLAEKDLTLDIAKRLAAQLEHAGFSVGMTRQGDQFVPLSERAGLANRQPADLFVSVHVNANRDPGVSGAEVYYPRESAVGSQTPLPPGVENGEVALATRTVREILWDLVLGRSRSRSFQLARRVCQSLEGELQVGCRVKPARFVVLREAQMPAILVEVGYMSHAGEAGRLSREDYREAAARGVAAGIEAYGRASGNGTP